MICSSVKRDPFISASYSGRTLLKTGGVCGAQVKIEGSRRRNAYDDAAEARELVRGLVEAIVLAPDDGKLAVTVRGALASILQLAAGAKHVGARGDITDTFVLCEQIKMVAGAGFEPAAFRL